MTKDLTKLALENLKPGPTRREVPDGHTRGLYFVLQPSGKASWALRYRASGKPRKLTLGPYPEIDLKVARELARKALAKVAAGADPAAEKQTAKAAARAPADHDLVENVVPAFIERYAKKETREKTWRETERLLTREVVGKWRGRRLSEIKRPDIHNLLDSIADRHAPVVAIKTFAALRGMGNWATERGLIDVNPCSGIKAPAQGRSRDRVLDDDELRSVWFAAEALGYPFGPLVQLLVLTGQRLREVAEARWTEVDLAARLWTLPAERCKNGKTHQVPLSPQAVAILEGLPRIKGERGFIFTTNGKTAVSGFSKARARLGAALPDAPPFVLHDLRRSVATNLQKLGVKLEVTEAVLNHVSGSRAGIVGVYQRHTWSDEKRAALAAWAQRLETIVTGAPPRENVVELAKAEGVTR